MKIDIISDLHLHHLHEVVEAQTMFSDGDLLIVAGDLTNTYKEFWHTGTEFLSVAKRHYKDVLYVLGNHEFYDYEPTTIKSVHDTISAWCYENSIHFMCEPTTMDIQGKTFFGGTMWGDCHQVEYIPVIRAMLNDFRYIYTNNKTLFTPNDSIDLNRKFREKLLEAKADVVVTHFAPTRQSISDRFEGSLINSYFANDGIERFIETSEIKLWVHGHTHDTFDYIIGGTRIVCNPKGYVGENKDTKIVQVEI